MPCPVTARAEKALTMPGAARLALAASLGALAFVLIMQYGFGLQPCILCLWQRGPYGMAAALSLLALLWRPYGRQSAVLLALCSLCFLAGLGLAVFHSGVELHWWAGTASCSVQPLHGQSPEDLRMALLHVVTARCDEIAWTFLGLSMANWNSVASLILAVFTTIAAAKTAEN